MSEPGLKPWGHNFLLNTSVSLFSILYAERKVLADLSSLSHAFFYLVELVNSQVILIGRESKGALLITASNANIMKRLHRPVDTNNDVILKLNKVTWSGELKNLQVSLLIPYTDTAPISFDFCHLGHRFLDHCAIDRLGVHRV